MADTHPDYIPMSIPDHVAGLVRRSCEVCMGEGWVCEDHPLSPWESGAPADCRCGAAGMPCVCTGLVTVSQADRQPPTSSSVTNSSQRPSPKDAE